MMASSATTTNAVAGEDITTTKLLWNRETCSFGTYDDDNDTIVETARIVCLSDPNDPANVSLYGGGKDADADVKLGKHARVLQIAASAGELDWDMLKTERCNVVFVSHKSAKEPLARVLQELPIQWIHARSAGIDFVHSPSLAKSDVVMSNAKGQFSSTLAEYTMGAITWFAKDFDRLRKSQQKKNWDKYSVREIRGSTLGIVGYGDIGRATAKLAKAYGMKVIALRKHPQRDEYADEVWTSDRLNEVFARSDYVLCAAPLTPETHKMIGKEQFEQHPMSDQQVFINLGRGPVVDEDALIEALQKKRLKGAALDVFAQEPLPSESGLWDCDNLLLSPHNMDQTDTFLHEACEFFVREQVPRFVRGLPLYNPVDKAAGY